MILMMGIAGSGKGTQSQLLGQKNGFHLLTMGDVIRTYVTGAQREKMLAGHLLDDQDVIAILDTALASAPAEADILLDGFPRTIPQAEWLLAQSQSGRFKLDRALHLVASREAVKERLVGRARVDDNGAAIEKRFDEYERSTAPLLAWLKEHGIQVIDINAEQTVEAVHNDILQALNEG